MVATTALRRLAQEALPLEQLAHSTFQLATRSGSWSGVVSSTTSDQSLTGRPASSTARTRT